VTGKGLTLSLMLIRYGPKVDQGGKRGKLFLYLYVMYLYVIYMYPLYLYVMYLYVIYMYPIGI
jgi:hypothetical protein